MRDADRPVDQIPPGVVTLADHEAFARTRMDANAWAYFSGGAGNETTLHSNQAAWQQRLLQPRVLRDMKGGHTRLSLLGRTLTHPVLLAPVAYQRMAHPDGEVATACAASALEAGMVLSTTSQRVTGNGGTGRGPRSSTWPVMVSALHDA